MVKQQSSYHERSTSEMSYRREESSCSRRTLDSMATFPFYRFGNWGMNSFGGCGSPMRIQASRPIRDQFGHAYNIGASFDNKGTYHFIKYSNAGNGFDRSYQVVGSIPSRFPNHLGYFHAYGMTENYFLFCEQPVAFNVSQLMSSGYSSESHMEYMQGETNHFYIMDKRSGKSMEMNYVSDRPYFFYQFINCYETENRIIIDALGYDNDFGPSVRSPAFFTERYSSSKIMRFTLPLNSGSQGLELDYMNGAMNALSPFMGQGRLVAHPEYLFRDSGLCAPFINSRYNFRKYRFAYGYNGSSLMKFDYEGGRTLSWRSEGDFWRHNRSCFVANPNGSFEDDGVIISYFSDTRNSSQNTMIFLDAHNMEEITRLGFNGRLPFESHFPALNSHYF
eukprot:TRINITY_DN1937_c0_g1_i1.p1 TRINITY_DN1937_c0_g1~~TRINITY_DN1937_c0_g1_i1.p1  ORF type:complete len:427 (-),score=126.68 TRINITY_DN1937_c0_g1_i1:128-1303(-)